MGGGSADLGRAPSLVNKSVLTSRLEDVDVVVVVVVVVDFTFVLRLSETWKILRFKVRVKVRSCRTFDSDVQNIEP